MTVNKAVRKKNIKRKKGKIIGGWTLVKKFGQGGNGDVWEISQEGVDNHAMKFLLSPDEVSYQRFKAEIHILSSISIDGVIPLIDSNIPETSEESTPWFTMPKAYECTDLLQKKSTLDIAESFIALIETLELLHDKKIAHRDIKPANILFYEGRLCFSDFGLVKYPKKENITPKQRDVGAKFTMAPEMRRHASEADGMPADIYSLAKTLWIFMTGQEKGFDGQYNPNSILSIKKYCSDVRTTKLDNLLVECTDNVVVQ